MKVSLVRNIPNTPLDVRVASKDHEIAGKRSGFRMSFRKKPAQKHKKRW